MRQSVFLASLFLGAALSPLACAGVEPSSLLAVNFQDHAVLQRDQAIPLWGKAAPGARLTLLFDGKKTTAKADKNGRWQATLPAHGAGGPYTLSVSDAAGHSQNAADVMVGDNFLCSGQSNMEWPVHLAMQGDTDANAAGNPNIRLFRVQRAFSAAPQQDFTSHEQWEVTSPQSVRDFSAVCYYFGRALQPQIKVPVGLIYSAWGGSTIETWMGADALAKSGGYDGALKALKIYATSPEAAMADWHKSMLGWWQDHDPASAASPAWHDPAYDDSTWHEVVPAGPMRDLGAADLASFYGIVWLRTTVTVSEAQAKQGADLMLGPIDQVDTSWVNGKDVGSMEGWGTERTYHIAPGTLKAGANVIAVGFYGGDGLWGPAGARQLRFADGSAVAVGPRWRYHTSVEGYKAGRIPHAPWLKEIGQSVLYNAMIAPIGKVPLKGVLWYQGESNVGDDSYGRLLGNLMTGWRAQFGKNTPFLLVQLPNYGLPVTKPGESAWANIREIQRQVTLQTPNTYLVPIIDMGDRYNLHPVVKQEVGRRLALTARHRLYGQKVVDAGPTPLSVQLTGDHVRVHFDNVGGGLIAYGLDDVVGFALCDAGNSCRYVRGKITGTDVELSVPAEFRVTKVRYGWADTPISNLYNADGLPAVPFEQKIGG